MRNLSNPLIEGEEIKALESCCQRHNTEIIVMSGEATSPEQELVQDLIAIITVFASRLHGLRSYKKAIKDAALHKD